MNLGSSAEPLEAAQTASFESQLEVFNYCLVLDSADHRCRFYDSTLI